MRILIPGGTGQVGTLLARHLYKAGHEVTVLTRNIKGHPEQRWRTLAWDGVNPGPWADEIDRSDAVIHLSGRSVNCRYTDENRREIMDSRVKPTLLLGQLIAASPTPPRVWMNASTATFYRNALDLPQDEFSGEPGDLPGQRGVHEPRTLPASWAFSIDVAHKWEAALRATPTPNTRQIALRTSLALSPDRGGVFSVFANLCRFGLGGTQGSGKQYISWMHEHDYCRATDLLLDHPEITDETNGIVNMTAPEPLPNKEFFRVLREAMGVRVGLPAPAWLLEIGTFLLRTESELVLKSRRAVPTLLLKHNFDFLYPTFPQAARNLVRRLKTAQ